MTEIVISRMLARFNYDPELGSLRFRTGTRRGALAGSKRRRGDLDVMVDGVRYGVHRIAWAMHYREQPPRLIDHINGDPGDNRIENLRPATHSQNAANAFRHGEKKLGLAKGVSLTPAGRYAASVYKDGVRHNCGTFGSEDEAHAAYLAKASAVFGEYANAGYRE